MYAIRSYYESLDDGMMLKNAYITAAVRCAPPQNKPTKEEMNTCFDYLKQEYQLLKEVTVILCLGKIAYDTTCKLIRITSYNVCYTKLLRLYRSTAVPMS